MTTLPESDFILITDDDLEPDPRAADLAQRQPENNEPPERIQGAEEPLYHARLDRYTL